jgi:hypothetical protein
MKGNLHVRFLEEGEGAIPSSYSAIRRIITDLRFPIQIFLSVNSPRSILFLIEHEKRINRIRVHPCAVCNPCSMSFAPVYTLREQDDNPRFRIFTHIFCIGHIFNHVFCLFLWNKNGTNLLRYLNLFFITPPQTPVRRRLWRI